MTEIYHCFWVQAPSDRVYAALTEREGLAGWWTEDLEVIGTVGSVSTFRFKSGAFNRMKIVALEPDLIEWKCVDGHEEWIGTRVTFRLRREGKRTKVCFSHSGWRESTEYMGECSFHWASYFAVLQKYCTSG